MQIVTTTGAQWRLQPGAAELCRAYAFVADAWPGWDPAQAAESLLAGLDEELPVVALKEGAGWRWLAGVQRLEFDSRLFGLEAGRLQPLLHAGAWPRAAELQAGAEFMAAALELARGEGLEFLSARVPCRDFLCAQVLEGAGFRLVDASVEWLVGLEELPPAGALQEGFAIRPWRAGEEPALAELAGRTMCELESYADRFALDPRLREHCPELYRRWLLNCLDGDQADQVLVLEAEGRPAGFISLRLPRGDGPGAHCGWVVLNALDHPWRGRGLYHHLLRAGLGWLAGSGARQARVRTKLSQQAVIRAFARLGGRQAQADFTFHLWLDRSQE